MDSVRVGFGYDVHRFGGDGPVVLAGVTIQHSVGVVATSDGDVATHAVCDALLGAVADGDLGTHFPSSDSQWRGADSLDMLRRCVLRVVEAGYVVGAVDVTLVVQNIAIAPHRQLMRSRLSEAMGISVEFVSVKATTTDGLGWIGNGAGLAAHAVVTVHI